MSRIIFNLAAKCDRAGRSQNQDNYWVCPDLTKWNAPLEKIVGTDEDVELSDKGALLVVADGMGGMNAGEVASKLVIEGIKKKFSNIPDSILTNEAEISSFIHSAIVESDESIKQYAKEHKDAEGLGSTIVLLWLLNGRAFCGWCGDSRIYRFNPNNELVRLSHDHSYVQSLVDEGKITEEEAFDHPDGNIISKALGDNGNKADPEIRVYDIYSRDVFMLCSDGLCGLLQDSELNEIISRDCTSSKETLNSLWNEGEKAGWSDNATIDVLCVVDGGKPAKGRPDGYPVIAKKPVDNKGQNKPQIVSGGDNALAKILKPPYLYILAFIAVCILGIALYTTHSTKESENSSNYEYNVDPPVNGNAAENSSSGNTDTPGKVQTSTGGKKPGGSSPEKPAKPQKPSSVSGDETPAQVPSSASPSGGGLQGVLDQYNGISQGEQPQATYPSDDYLRVWEKNEDIYYAAKKSWGKVKSENQILRPWYNDIYDFYMFIDENIKNLQSDKNNYDAMPPQRKSIINEYKKLRDDIKQHKNEYGLEFNN